MAAVMHDPVARFVVQAIVIIALSRVVGLLARRVNQPMVIAEIVAGIMLGPSLLGWLWPQATAALFPQSSMGMLNLMSQVGLILFMFLVGLEFDPKLLKGRGHTSVLISHTSIIVPFALGALVAFVFRAELAEPSAHFGAFVLFMGVAMSITAFPVLARILVERHLLRSRVGAVTIACAAVDDVTAWCLLAFVVAIARSSGVAGAMRTTIVALGYITVMMLLVRPLLGRLGARAANREGLTQNVVAVVLLGVLLSSWATDLIGIHALFGAFVVGAILPKEGGFAHALAEKLEDLVVVLLLPLFFAFSGLRTQVRLLDSGSAWGMCALLIAVACVGKFGGSAIPARLTGLSWRESSALGILVNTRGLVELVALNIGLDLGVISPKVFTMMVIMALVTTFMTSPLLDWIYPPGELAKELVEDADTPAATAVPSFTLLACVANESSGPSMATLGAALVGHGGSDGRLYALQLIRPANRASFVLGQQHAASDEVRTLAPLIARARDLDVPVRPLAFVSGDPADDICRVAELKNANLVLLGWHKSVLGKAALGGVVHEVMNRARTDVGVLVDHGLRQISRVLVPYLGPGDSAALALSRRVAEHTGATVTVLHVVRPGTGAERLGVQQRVNAEFHEGEDGRNYQVRFKAVPHEKPALAAIEEAESGYDLVIIGVGPEWNLEHRSFGIQTEIVIARCQTSLLVVRHYEVARAVAIAATPASQPRQSFKTLPGES